MTLLSGRAFTDADDATAPPVAIVNLSMARHNFPDIDPVGRRVSLDNGRTWITIVGVVNDTHDYGLDEKPTDELYRAFAQTGPLNATLLVRTAADPGVVRAPRFRPSVHEVDPRQPVSQIRTLEVDSQPLAGAAATDGDAGHAVRRRRADHHRGRHRRRRLVLGQPADDGDRRADGARRAALERDADDRAAGADAGDDRARAAASPAR